MAKKASTGKKSKEIKNSDTVSVRFVELSEKFDSVKVQPYRMANMYAIEAKIEHPKFGIGFVVSSFPNKIEVVFEDVSRQLVQGRK